ncbi:transmembrane protein, putative (macronuclear) [Tetrahymena thermophila SB210]|uniref:Transmembrane protein, putative n=1 Tax=Tetrahymena thermophila (strain SB210) TaxID=312017 RepID=Q23MM3_TETTS|nr:transmembrane protein, putative [Tetrahymena thermophila SB210]EAR97819.2 transmembrane protein, putative [Tetrahymena thermophila SB210]|eukprot:XP_001018064.2 transmembrane protein, putative [Tetrahymena thermophila SB210]
MPGSVNSCTSCISNTRFLNQTSNTCDCLAEYEEIGQVDCQKIADNISSQQINFIENYFYTSFYIQIPFIFLPIYTHQQYSFKLQQVIGILGLLQATNNKNLRIQAMSNYNIYNFYNFSYGEISQQSNTLLMYLEIYSIIYLAFFLVTLVLKITRVNKSKFTILRLIQDNSFITCGRFLSTFSIFLLIHCFDYLIEQQKLTLVFLTVLLTMYLFYLINILIVVYQIWKKERQVVFGTSEDFIQEQIEAKFKFQILTMNICQKQSLRTLIWIFLELRQIATIFLLNYFKNSYIGFVSVFGISILFLILHLYYRYFSISSHHIFVVSAEIKFLIILILNTVLTLLQQPQQQQSISIYPKLTILDILNISLLIIWQSINILLSVYTYYRLIQQIIKLYSNQNSKNFSKSEIPEFPIELNESNINQILSQTLSKKQYLSRINKNL